MSAQLKEKPTPVPLHRWELKGGHVALVVSPDHVSWAQGRKGVQLLTLGDFWVPPRMRGRGVGSGLMEAATRWADRNRTDLWLYAQPFGPGPRMPLAPLLEMYRYWGFRRVAPRSPDVEMIRRYVEHRDQD